MNQSLMQKMQRLSPIKEIKEMMKRLDAEHDGNASSRSLELAEDGGQDSDISIRHNRYSMVGSGNVQLYAPKVYHVIPIERILCKADILPDLVTTTIPEDALPASAAARARDYPHAKPGSELYIYNNWSMQWGLHPGNPPKEAP